MLILLSVRNEPKYGYEIIKELREMFDGAWEPKTGAMYPSMKKLQDSGLLSSEMKDDKEYYNLTEEGRELLMNELPKIGAMASFVTRFSSIISQVIEEMGLQVAEMDHRCAPTRDEKLKHLIEMRKNMESDLMSINDAIERIMGGNCEHN